MALTLTIQSFHLKTVHLEPETQLETQEAGHPGGRIENDSQ
jgi:hypothetical protein